MNNLSCRICDKELYNYPGGYWNCSICLRHICRTHRIDSPDPYAHNGWFCPHCVELAQPISDLHKKQSDEMYKLILGIREKSLESSIS